MKQFEYRVDSFTGNNKMYQGHDDEKEYLKTEGLRGWELLTIDIDHIAFGTNYYYWKKEIIETKILKK